MEETVDEVTARYEREEKNWQRARKRRNRKLRKNWPEGKRKSQVVLEWIGEAGRKGRTEQEIRQFVWEKNGNKGPAPRYYWMTLLRYPESYQDWSGLLDAWCIRSDDKTWRLRPRVKLEAPWLRWDPAKHIEAQVYFDLTGHDPYADGVRIHENYDGRPCHCPIPPDHVIDIGEVPEPMRWVFAKQTQPCRPGRPDSQS